MTTSGTTSFQPPIADLLVEAYSRIQIRGAELTTEHVVEARRTANLILNDWSGNRSVNLWAVDLLTMTLVPGQATYTLPADTIQLLDVYTRQYQFNTTVTATLGNALTPILVGGVPMVSMPYGDPMVLAPGSNTLSSVAGSTLVTVNWPAHGLQAGEAINFLTIASIGGVTLPYSYTVQQVIDINTFTFNATLPAQFTSTNQGATPLFSTTAGSSTVTVILPGHNLSPGGSFPVSVATTVGGLTIPIGTYPIVSVPTSYSFTFVAPGAPAAATTAVFENNGQLQLTTQQQSNVDPIDIILYGLSRSEYAAIPDKFIQGRPTTFWFNRQIVPTITVWEVPPPPSQTGGISYGLQMYRMREIQDANPVMNQTPEMPGRFYQAFAAELTAGLAEKYAPAQFVAKMQLASAAWQRAAQADSENVPWFITPGLFGYYNN